jgi:RimJ/RimL family protein N-acetyltransferase
VYVLRTPRLVLRAWAPDDAPSMKAAIDASLPELKLWMPWALTEPTPLPQVRERCARFAGDFASGRDWIYGIFAADGVTALGGSGLHRRRGPKGLEIGYWLRTDRWGQGLITESTAALTRAALELLKMRRVEIRCDPANTRSAAVPHRLGYVHRTTLKQNTTTVDGKPRDTLLFLVRKEEWSRSHPAFRPLRVEAPGGEVLLDEL